MGANQRETPGIKNEPLAIDKVKKRTVQQNFGTTEHSKDNRDITIS